MAPPKEGLSKYLKEVKEKAMKISGRREVWGDKHSGSKKDENCLILDIF